MSAPGIPGGVDHFANDCPRVTVGNVGRRYRLVRSELVNGVLHEQPLDARLFDSVYVARAEAAALRSQVRA